MSETRLTPENDKEPEEPRIAVIILWAITILAYLVVKVVFDHYLPGQTVRSWLVFLVCFPVFGLVVFGVSNWLYALVHRYQTKGGRH